MLDWVQTADQTALWWIAEHTRNALLTPPLSIYTQLGNKGLLFIVLALVLLLFRSTRKGGAGALVSMLLGLLVTNITIKPLVSRMRPWVVMDGFINLVEESDPNSFPSGHSCAAFAFAVSLCILLPKRWMKATALVLAVVMALSRLYVGVHFPSDVIVGVIIGSICGLLGALIVQKVTQWYQSRRGRRLAK